jgi:hypothetical protein
VDVGGEEDMDGRKDAEDSGGGKGIGGGCRERRTSLDVRLPSVLSNKAFILCCIKMIQG